MNKQEIESDEQERKIYKLIIDDVNRTLPEYELFKYQKIRQSLPRALYIWHVRHPASGYV